MNHGSIGYSNMKKQKRKVNWMKVAVWFAVIAFGLALWDMVL